MARKLMIVILLLVVVGAIGGASMILFHRKNTNENLDRLHMAEAMIQSKDYDGAVKNLLPVVQVGKRFDQAPYALYLLAQASDGAGLKESADYWKRLADDFPESEYAQEARLRQADRLLESDPGAARGIYAELSQKGRGKIRSQSLLGVAKAFEKENNTEKTRQLYYDIIASVTDFSVVAEAKDRLSALNTQMLWSPVLDEFCQLYTVEKGDAAVKIGTRFGTTAWFVEEANHVSANRLNPGSRVKVPKEPYHILVSKELCRLELRTAASDKFVKWYPVGVGEQSYKTPAGEYKIVNKQINPTWYKPEGGVVPPGTPENALGPRWLGIGRVIRDATSGEVTNVNKNTGLGIHGTNAPETIGHPKSAGCIRMYNQDVEELYKLVTYGTRVTIIDGTEMIGVNESTEPQNAQTGTPEGQSATGNI